MALFKELCIDPDMEWQFIDDGSIVKAHQHNSSGAAHKEETAIGKYGYRHLVENAFAR